MGSIDLVKTSLGSVKPWARSAADELVTDCPWQVWFWWGAPGRGTGDHAVGLAVDLTVHDGGTVNDPGPLRKFVGDWIAARALADHERLGLTYVIWFERIASPLSNPPWSWREYDGSNPHVDHVHLSFKTEHTYQPPEDDMPTVQEIAKAVADLDAKPYGGVAGVSLGEYIVGAGVKLDAEKQRDKGDDAQDAADQTEMRELLGQVAASLNLIHKRLNEIIPPS
ncbi:hypothetical protein [Tenggerimyces flavus]|uniref:ARB-07466-like C-terminal domain-containing protein n=1 Tax=Tenggerimyces flavus TaxID=1708749 RepID=A0ABV7YED2_9ACTN|nr:hypothetical protein [Tenggerimyces flavus]MBM7788844.1 hypothetical protein [Tenggerimyces flavus]